MDPLQFNQSQGIDESTIRRIQRTVGASADGKWGQRTIRCIRKWQAAQGLTADGRCGRGTMETFEAVWATDDQPCDDEALDDRSEDDTPLEPSASEAEVQADANAEALSFGDGFAYFDQATDIDSRSTGPEVLALLNDLFAFGFIDDVPGKTCGKQGAAAIEAFQRAAMTAHRIHQYRRVEVPITFTLRNAGVVDAPTRAEIRLWKSKGYRWQAPGEDFIERRVRVNKLGTLPRSSLLLVDVPGTGGKPRKLHCLAAAALAEMVKACKADTRVGLLVQSGWRRHRWTSRAQYEQELDKRYGSVQKGCKFLAFDSPHETGLAVDFGSGGLEAKSATAAKQKQTPVYAWLVANAYRFGFHPYRCEPWHWEFPLSPRAWITGESDWRLSDDD